MVAGEVGSPLWPQELQRGVCKMAGSEALGAAAMEEVPRPGQWREKGEASKPLSL